MQPIEVNPPRVEVDLRSHQAVKPGSVDCEGVADHLHAALLAGPAEEYDATTEFRL
jgi:hypothetical protein